MAGEADGPVRRWYWFGGGGLIDRYDKVAQIRGTDPDVAVTIRDTCVVAPHRILSRLKNRLLDLRAEDIRESTLESFGIVNEVLALLVGNS